MASLKIKIEDLLIKEPRLASLAEFSNFRLRPSTRLYITNRAGVLSALGEGAASELQKTGNGFQKLMDGVEFTGPEGDLPFGLLVLENEGVPKHQGYLLYDGTKVVYKNVNHWGTLVGKVGSSELSTVGGPDRLHNEERVISQGDQVYIGNANGARRYRLTILK